MIYDKSVLIVPILIANLSVDIIQPRLNHSQMAMVIAKVFLPLGVRVRCLLADIQLMRYVIDLICQMEMRCRYIVSGIG